MAKTPYEIIGVSKTASDADIKAAYRKLAKKYHPDLNPGSKDADNRFKEISAAYDLLGDKQKRAAYDRGEVDMQGQPQRPQYYRDYAQNPQGRRYQSFNEEELDTSGLGDLFSSFFRNAGRGSAQTPPPADARYSIDVDFLEAARGGNKRVTLPDGRTLDIRIPAGINEGQQLRLKGQGNKDRSGKAGDAYVDIHIKPHPHFSRNGHDITVELPIALQESVLGGKVEVPTIHGPVEMTIPKGASSGATLRLKGKGIAGGDQYVKLRLVMPEKIDSDFEKLVQEWSQKHSYNPRKDGGGV